MNKVKILKALNPVLFLLLLSQMATGLLIFLDAGEAFTTVHLITGGCLVLVGIAHLTLNWNWVAMQYFRKGK